MLGLGTVQGMKSPLVVYFCSVNSLFSLVYECQICCFNLMLLIDIERSSLARGISDGNLAEGVMAFNTNYRDTGIFGIYTVAPVIYCSVFLALF